MRAVILQARLDSSRLPQKALLPLGDYPLLVRVMHALKQIPAAFHILACPEDCRLQFDSLAQAASFQLFSGSKNDVLGRYCAAIRHYKPDYVLRATGDNPFVFSDAAALIADEAETFAADYAAYSGLPYGAGVEAVASEALLRAERESTKDYDREHVCPYLYTHPESFLLHRPLAPLYWRAPQCRLTVDTSKDYEAALQLNKLIEKKLSSADRSRGKLILDCVKCSGVADV